MNRYPEPAPFGMDMHRRSERPMRFLLPLLLSALILLPGCGGEEEPAERLNTEFEAEGILDFHRPDSSLVTRIVIEMAESDAEQAQGLMYRRSLPNRGGMLFIDDAPSMQSFWMRNTPLPLDILFIDESGEIVNIVRRTTPYSEERIESTDSAQYVLEVRAGFTDRYGITDSMRVEWERRELTQNGS